MSDALSLFYDESAEMGLPEYEKLLQSLLWVADDISLPPFLRLNPRMDETTYDHLSGRLTDLQDAGLLSTWDLDGDPPIRFRPGIRPWKSDIPSRSLRAIAPATYEELYEDVRLATDRYRSLLKTMVAQRRGVRLEGITEYVSLQGSLWSLGLANIVGADQILTTTARDSALDMQLAKAKTVSGLTQPVVESLMQLTNIGSLVDLTVDELLSLRRALPFVREYLLSTIQRATDGLGLPSSEALSQEVTSRVEREFMHLVIDQVPTGRKRATSMAVDWTATVLGLTKPILSVASFAAPVMRWALDRRGNRRVVVFVTKLRRVTAQ